ncbi:MAG: DUF1836 domain-containing protein [Clostridia bacterium]|nr:DUF1836 domain-containing protein [Clostridia bacterium]
MNYGELREIMGVSLKEKVLRSSDIPSIDLYLDQILTLVSDKTEKNALTKTMINNYSKDGLIKPVKGKKYTKEHIVQMLIICYLKGVLSIGDIKRIFDGIYADDSFDGEKLIDAYDRFLDIRSCESELCEIMVGHYDREDGLDISATEDFLVMLMSIVSLSDSLRRVAIELLSARYPQKDKTSEQKSEKADKNKEKKQKNTKEDHSE